VFGLLLLAATAGAQEEKAERTYEVRVDRKATVGRRYRLVVTDTREERQLAFAGDEEVARTESLREGKLTAVCETTRVDEDGREIALSCTVEAFFMTLDGTETRPLPKGVTLLAELKDGDTVVRREDGADLSEPVRKLLADLLALSRDIDDPKAFGPPQRRRIGETWAGDSEAILASVTRKDLVTGADDIDAKVTFTGTSSMAGREMLEIAMKVDVKIAMEVPDDVTVERATATIELAMALDADPERSVPGRLTGKMRAEIHIAREGSRKEARMRAERSAETTPIDE
jgi:hypothetical protein